MGKTRHEKSFVDFDKPYETNLIGLRGIIYFGIGLFLLIVITFGLMWFLQNVMEEQILETERENRNPMAMDKVERLPPGPRLQVAPGFEVDGREGRVNLELKRPQAEWDVLQEQYKEIWEKGQKTENGEIVSLPIEEAKKRMLEQNVKADQTGEGQKTLEDSRSLFSSASSGRVNSITIR